MRVEQSARLWWKKRRLKGRQEGGKEADGGRDRERGNSREEIQGGVKFFFVMGGVKRERKSTMRVGERRRGESVIEEQSEGEEVGQRTLKTKGRKGEVMGRRNEKIK